MIALDICQKMDCKTLILKSDSPTCSSQNIYSGNFNNTKKQGVGVFAALLIKNGIKVYDEKITFSNKLLNSRSKPTP